MFRRPLVLSVVLAFFAGPLAFAPAAHAAPVSPGLAVFVDVWNESPTREYGTVVPIVAQTQGTDGFSGVPGAYEIRRNGVRTSSGWSSRGTFSTALEREDAAGTYEFEFAFVPDDAATYLPETKTVTVVRPKAAQSIDLGAPATAVRVGSSWTLPEPNPANAQLAVRSGSTAGACTVTGRRVDFARVGTCTVDVTAAESINYLAATPRSVTFTVTRTATRTQADWDPSVAVKGEEASLQVALLAGEETIPGTAEIWVDGSREATLDLDDGVGSWRTHFSAPGRYDVEVRSTPIDPGFAPSFAYASIQVRRQQQAISMPPNPAYVGDTWTPTADGGGPVTASSRTPAVCDALDGQITFKAAGTCQVDSSAGPTADYEMAEQFNSFTVTKVPVTLTASVVSETAARQRLEVVATSPRGTPTGSLSLNVDGDTASRPLVDGRVSWTVSDTYGPTSTLELRAVYSSGTTIWASSTIVRALTVPKVVQRLAITPPADARVGGTWTPDITWADTPRPRSWFATGACAAEGDVVRFTEVGDCTVSALQTGDAAHDGGSATSTFAVRRLTPSFSPTPVPAYVDDSWSPSASNGAAVTATSTTPGICTTAGGVVTFLAAGSCVVDLSVPETAAYDAVTVRRTVTVTKVPVTLTAVGIARHGRSPITVTLGSLRGTPTGRVDLFVLTGGSANDVPLVDGRATVDLPGLSSAGDAYTVLVTYRPDSGRWGSPPPSVRVTLMEEQAVSIAAPTATARPGGTWTPAITWHSSPQPTSWTATGACTREDDSVRFMGVGSCSVIAVQEAGGMFLEGRAERVVEVRSPLPTLSATPSPAYVDDTWSPTASGDAPVTATSTTTAVCRTTGGTVTFRAAGSCVVDLSVPATAEYDATTVRRTVAVTRVPVTATVEGIARSDRSPLTVTLTSPRGTPTGTVDLNSPPAQALGVRLVDGVATLHLDGPRRPRDQYNLRVEYFSDSARWGDFNQMFLQPFRGEQTVRITAPTETARVGETWTPVIAWDASGMPRSWGVAGACSRQGSAVRFTTVGSCRVLAVQDGSTVYFEGRDEIVVPVQKGRQTISLGTPAPSSAYVGDRWTPLATGGASGNSVGFSAGPIEFCERVGATVEFRDAGTCSVGFDQDGNADYEQGERSLSIEVERVPVALTLDADDLAVGVAGVLEVGATAGGQVVPGQVTVTVTGGGVSVSGAVGTGPAELPVTFAHAGTHALTVSFEPTDATTYAEASEQASVVVAKGAQAITLSRQPPATALVGDTWRPSVTGGGSGEPVTLVASGACERAGTQIRFTAAGTCTLAFDQPGTADWVAAPTVTTTTEVGLVPVDVTVTAPDDARVGAATELEVVTSAPGTVEVVVDGQTVRGTGPTLPVTFTRAGEREATVSFTPADPATHQTYAGRTVLTVAKGVQQLALGEAAPATRRAGGSWTPAATGGDSGSPVQVSAGPAAICTAASGTVSFATAGDCEVTLTQAGSADYDAAPALRRTVSVERRTPTFGVELPTGARVGEPAAVTVRSDEAGTVRFELDDEVVGDPVTVTGGVAVGTLLPTAAGERRVTAAFTPSAPSAVAGAEREVTLDVGRARTGTVLTIDAEGLAATVTPTHAAAGVPTGVVVFAAGDRELGRVALVAGVALLDRPLDADWAGEVTASYAGDADRDASSGSVRRVLPTITGTVRAVRPAVDGWYDAPVVVEFACGPGSAAVTTCPGPVELGEGRAQTITRAVTAADGGRAIATVGDLSVDASGPEVAIRGVRPGELVKGRAPAACRASDAGAGLASCHLVHRKAGRSWVVTATATDRVGHTEVARVRYRQSRAWELFHPAGEVGTVEPGERAWVVVLTDGARPLVTGPLGRAGQVVRANRFRGLTRWHVAVRFPDDAARGASYPVRVRGGGTSEVVRFRVG